MWLNCNENFSDSNKTPNLDPVNSDSTDGPGFDSTNYDHSTTTRFPLVFDSNSTDKIIERNCKFDTD